jgi:hypothetical protein
LPVGDLAGIDALARPNAQLAASVGELCSVTSARLRLANPPLADARPPGVGTVMLAAAVGGRSEAALAQALASEMPRALSALDLIGRHGLVVRAIAALAVESGTAKEVRELLLERSPLTGLLDFPPEGGDAECMDLARRMLAQSDGRRLLVLHLAEPAANRLARRWQGTLLERLRVTDPEFVLDVYEAYLVHNEDAALQNVRLAEQVLRSTLPSKEALEGALAVADVWSALAALSVSHPEALRARPYLGYAYLNGVALYKRARRMTGVM